VSDQPLIMLGIDGLDWEYVDAHRAELPTLAGWPRLQPLRSVFPPDSIAAWTTIFTGISPGDHGFLDSIDYLSRRPASAAEAAGRTLANSTFWDEAARRGATVCVINPFLAHPAWDVNGLMISGPVFVSGEVSVTGRTPDELGPVPSLGGIVDFPTAKTMGSFLDDTLALTRQQADFGMRMLDLTGADLFFLNVLTLDRLQHFVWRFADPDDPTYPGPNPHASALLDSYRLIDRIAADFSERGRVLIVSDHGHGMRPTRMVFIDEALRRAGLLRESRSAPKLLSRTYLLERAKRLGLDLSYRWSLEEQAYRVGRRLPGRKAIKESSFSSDADASPARLSRTFGRNQHSGIELADDTPEMRQAALEVLSSLRDPRTGEGVVDWAKGREEVVQGRSEDRYPEILFRLREGYGVDYGIYGDLFGPDANHRRISGGHREHGVLATSFPADDPPESIEGVHDFVLSVL
jgi:predicted AlkP superfamily phosphohydrolase/phosphomutase